MAEDQAMEKISSEDEDDKNRKKKKEDYLSDPEFFSCVLQPSPADSDPEYIGIRRLLLHRKAQSGVVLRKDWRCNGKGYVGYRNYINRSRNWESMHVPSHSSTPGQRLLKFHTCYNLQPVVMIILYMEVPVMNGRWISSPAPFSLSFEVDSLTSSRELRSGNQALSHRLSFSTNASDSDRPYIKRAEPAYSFVGMHCIFDQCKAMVTVVKFGHMSSDILAYGASDGTLTVCNVSEPPSIIKQLIGHSKDVTGWIDWIRVLVCYVNNPDVKSFISGYFDFTSSNQYIASSSMDKTVRIWEISKGLCIRVMYGVTSQLCIRFHPVFNFSTGRVICKTVFDNEVTAMDHDHTGQLIFCGDAQGSVYSVSMDSRTGSLSRTHTHRSGNKHKSPVSTMQYRTFSLLARGPVLLAFTRDGNLSFFSVALEVQGYLTIRCSLQLSSRLHSIRASFCPLLSLEKGEYIVVGSEDANVYFYDLTRPRHPCVNKLQGHGYPVIGVAWNHGENFLASSDFGGTVIVWKRAKTG
ncbi:hypothetical protein RHGRI_013519 [Rhododendron griersonianum]|uniref:WD repeat-containing protein 13 n=1 Tax=Rhododendron griersonianum TaxID=479676 RepID=A0AAV6K5W3_9ERIC|nr:hypothetical protein RHGRI_013519 [Rhododendron griersonianum]